MGGEWVCVEGEVIVCGGVNNNNNNQRQMRIFIGFPYSIVREVSCLPIQWLSIFSRI